MQETGHSNLAEYHPLHSQHSPAWGQEFENAVTRHLPGFIISVGSDPSLHCCSVSGLLYARNNAASSSFLGPSLSYSVCCSAGTGRGLEVPTEGSGYTSQCKRYGAVGLDVDDFNYHSANVVYEWYGRSYSRFRFVTYPSTAI